MVLSRATTLRSVPKADGSGPQTPIQHDLDARLLWSRYCSFVDLPLRDFLEIQEELLLEQLDLIYQSRLGRHLLRGARPRSVEEFRTNVPLTKYGDYLPFLEPGNEEVLAEPPAAWAHTTGAQAGFKWVPYTRRGLERLLDNMMSCFIMAAASNRGEVKVWPGDTVLYNSPERPYLSGLVTFGMRDRFGFTGVLDPETSEALEFKARVRRGFLEALNKRVDVIVSMTSVLLKVGEGFAEHARRAKPDRSFLRPRALVQYGKAYVKSKFMGRPILPRDLWPAKAIIGWGIDTPFFRDKVKHYWGKAPFELYACTEAGIMGMQTWAKDGLVFNPYSDFLEFIPMEESIRSRQDEHYKPNTVLLSQVKPGATYEVVITNFYGMAFVRYRVGHFVQFLPVLEATPGAQLGHFTFLGRADDRIDLAGFTRIDEKTMWDALGASDLKVEEWTVRKEFDTNVPLLHLYLELREQREPDEVQATLDQKLKEIDPFYDDLETMLNIYPLRVTLLTPGTFDRFYDKRQKEGNPIGRLRPPHMNATDEDIALLLQLSR